MEIKIKIEGKRCFDIQGTLCPYAIRKASEEYICEKFSNEIKKAKVSGGYTLLRCPACLAQDKEEHGKV
jgi:hypothetical protein